MTDVKATANEEELSLFKVFLDIEGAPDTNNPNLPYSPTVRPIRVMLLSYPKNGAWEVSMALVQGPKVHASTGNLTKRNYDSTFVNPMDPDAETPEWLLAICRKWQKHLNGDSPLAQFQIYAHDAFLVCERCDTNVTFHVEDPRLADFTEAAGSHVCDPERVTAQAATAYPYIES